MPVGHLYLEKLKIRYCKPEYFFHGLTVDFITKHEDCSLFHIQAQSHWNSACSSLRYKLSGSWGGGQAISPSPLTPGELARQACLFDEQFQINCAQRTDRKF